LRKGWFYERLGLHIRILHLRICYNILEHGILLSSTGNPPTEPSTIIFRVMYDLPE
jgi:hypothetical protein